MLSHFLILMPLLASTFANEKEIVVYSARNEQLIKPIFEAYTKETGVKIKFTTDKEGPLLEKLKSEGANTPADILMTVDAGNLWLANKEGVLQPIKSKVLDNNIPNHLRSPDKSWYGLSIRARTIFYNKNKIKLDQLSTYEDLATPKFEKKLCLRSSSKVYNQSLVAMFIAEHGEKKSEEIVKGWVKNLATEVFSDDTKLLEAIDAGICEVGIANTYYYGRLLDKKPELNVGVFWPNQKSKGVHVNISGAGITKHSKNKELAQAFLEWLSTDKAQNLYADNNFEYPANAKVKPVALVASWGEFKQNIINVNKAGELQVSAVKLMDRALYK